MREEILEQERDDEGENPYEDERHILLQGYVSPVLHVCGWFSVDKYKYY